jgi:threonine dehydratase
MLDAYVANILKAKVYDVAKETPLEMANSLSRKLNNKVYLKREDLQPVFSFKLRGAYNKIANLTEAEKAKGIIASSAGNHAQGVALGAKKLGLKATIVMPTTTPPIKVKAVKNLGGEVILEGDSYDQAYEFASRLAKEKDLTFIHPYDDPIVIAGQGTIGMEILHQHSGALEAIFVPVGGGGLIAGIAAYVKSVRPEVKVIGVESEESACLYEAMRVGKRVTLKEVGIFADGVAVKIIGKETFKLCQKYVDEVIKVSTDEICAAIKDIFDDTRSIVEPAGALSVAGIKKYIAKEKVKNQHLVGINSGANMNFDRLRNIAERTELGERKEAILAVTIPEKPGSFKKFIEVLKNRSITEFNYRYADVKKANIFVGISLQKGREEKEKIIKYLHGNGYEIVDLTDNEMAKLHLRHMIGGKSEELTDEKLFHFEFPEKPGALYKFLSNMGAKWNISLFHYRNHGAAYGRVLVGMQVPKSETLAFKKFLELLGYHYTEETHNKAYRLFL